MSDVKIAVSTSGPVPDNQCALKDAVLFAASSDETLGHAEVIEAAKAFYAFLTNPAGDGTPSSPSTTAVTAQTTPA